jgi:hypothetical protein
MLGAPSSRDLRGRLGAVAWAIALVAVLTLGPLVSIAAGADPTPSPTETPTETPTPTPTPTPATVNYRLSLLRSGDFTRQYTNYQCVGASLQIMRNMIWSYNNRGPYLQKKLWRIARANSLFKADGGADPYGWTTATSLAGHGRYVLVASSTMTGAVKAAARGMATTGRPAGIVVWRGTHAWVLTGFEATADPRATDDFRVITVRMADPLWPYWHVRKRAIYRPGTRLYMSTLKRNFTAYHDSRRDDRIEGRYVAIVPLADGDPVPAGAWSPKKDPAPTATPTPAPTPSPSPSADAGGATGSGGDSGAAGPTASPTEAPTATPDPAPTAEPTALPTTTPEPSPSAAPTAGP